MYLIQKKENPFPENPYDWRDSTIVGILEHMDYCGHTVNFKSYSKSPQAEKASSNHKVWNESFLMKDCIQNQPEHTGRRFFWGFKTGYAVSEICKKRNAKCACGKYTARHGKEHKQAP